MFTDTVAIFPELIELRQQANYWRSRYAYALKRESAAKENLRQLKQVVRRQQSVLQEQSQQIEALKAKVALLQQQVFGRKSEKKKPPPAELNQASQSPEALPEGGRKRGKQPGAQGYGRKPHDHLPTEAINHDLSKQQQRCPQCGKPFVVFPGTEDSEEIDWQVRLVRRIHKRSRYRPTCHCHAVPGILTAPPAAKLIPKGLFSIGFWVQLLTEKFLLQRPLYRIRQLLDMQGLRVSGGTLTGGLRRIGELLAPLYAAILERSRAAHHWHMDETRWMVFEALEGKRGHRWWLWVVITGDTCSYLLDPSRSSEVPKSHLGENAEGIISADRYVAYKTLKNFGENLRIAFCWSHARRDFLRVREGYKELDAWGESWVARIAELYRHNDKRLEVLGQPNAFAAQDQRLRQQLNTMKQTRDQQLADESLHAAQRKALKSLREHWSGLTIFVHQPQIPMDNNEAERRLRNPVIGRKNYYGSGSIWSGALSAMLFTLFQTLLLNQIAPQKFLVAYFETCAENAGKPPERLEAFLPWSLSEERKAAWRYPENPP